MEKIRKSCAVYELSDELTALHRLNRLSRDVAGDIFSRLSDASDRASDVEDTFKLLGVFSGAIADSGWRLEVLLELLCSLDTKLDELEKMESELPDEPEESAADLSSEELERVLAVLTGKTTVSSKKLAELLRVLRNMGV